jgi:chemotaxis signal transduction protein
VWAKDRTAWAVESVQGFIALPLPALRRVPRLLAGHASRAIWGVAVYQDDLIWLLDLNYCAASVPLEAQRSLPCDGTRLAAA